MRFKIAHSSSGLLEHAATRIIKQIQIAFLCCIPNVCAHYNCAFYMFTKRHGKWLIPLTLEDAISVQNLAQNVWQADCRLLVQAASAKSFSAEWQTRQQFSDGDEPWEIARRITTRETICSCPYLTKWSEIITARSRMCSCFCTNDDGGQKSSEGHFDGVWDRVSSYL